MTILVQAAPKDDFTSMDGGVNKWVDQVIGPAFRQFRAGETWSPSINLYECDHNYWVVVDLAGVVAEHIDIRVEEGKMLISGSRQAPRMPGGTICMHLMEIDQGPFQRTLELPESVEAASIQACYRGGYLRIQIPKTTLDRDRTRNAE